MIDIEGIATRRGIYQQAELACMNARIAVCEATTFEDKVALEEHLSKVLEHRDGVFFAYQDFCRAEREKRG